MDCRKIISIVAASAAIATASAQDTPTVEQALADERRTEFLRRNKFDEAGIAYGTHIALANRECSPDSYALRFEYAHYAYDNMGFRTGIDLFFAGDNAAGGFAVPVQFSIRTGRLWGAAFSSYSPDIYRYGYDDVLGRIDGSYDSKYTFGRCLADILLSIIPKKFEFHAGFSPGYIVRRDGGAVTDIPMRTDHRFTATLDVGGRMIIPLWRFDLSFDMTYRCRLTDNMISKDGRRPCRSYVGLQGGLAFGF